MEGPGYFVEPTIITGLSNDADVVRKETFAPIVYVLKASSVDEAIKLNNNVDQGLSSSIFTKDIETVFSKVYDYYCFINWYFTHACIYLLIYPNIVTVTNSFLPNIHF